MHCPVLQMPAGLMFGGGGSGSSLPNLMLGSQAGSPGNLLSGGDGGPSYFEGGAGSGQAPGMAGMPAMPDAAVLMGMMVRGVWFRDACTGGLKCSGAGCWQAR